MNNATCAALLHGPPPLALDVVLLGKVLRPVARDKVLVVWLFSCDFDPQRRKIESGFEGRKFLDPQPTQKGCRSSLIAGSWVDALRTSIKDMCIS